MTQTNHQPAPLTDHDAPVDVAAIMRQVRRRIAERQGPQTDNELAQALHTLNAQWDKIYEPLRLPPMGGIVGRVWNILRGRLHWEVRGYLDPMIYRQTEWNAAAVRAFNSLGRRSQYGASEAELESLRDEIVQLRERIRHLEERLES
jgi:hypothetical protein